MDRREFISGGGVAGVALLAGCSAVQADPANIEIERVEHPDTVEYDETITVEVDLTNTGEEEGKATVEITIGDSLVDQPETRVASDDTNTLSFTADAGNYDFGTKRVTVTVDHDEKDADAGGRDEFGSTIQIEKPAPAELRIRDVNAPESTPHDEPFEITVSIYNSGDLTAEQTLNVAIDGDTAAMYEVRVDGNEETKATVSVPEDAIFDGMYNLTVDTRDDEITTRIRVENSNPYGKQTLVVGLKQRTPARHDIQMIVEDALEYWEANSESYAGYPIKYDYRPNAIDPDVQITLVETIDRCGQHAGDGEIAGCAPLVRDRAPSTAEIKIADGYRQEWMTTTLKHEIGHTLGLDHRDEPAHIMSSDIEDRIPNYAERQTAIENYIEGLEDYVDGVDAWNEALNAWNNGEYAATEEAAVEAHNHMLDARQRVSVSLSVAESLNENTAYRQLSESDTHIEKRRLAAEAAIEMAREALTYGDPEPYRQDANVYLEESNTYTLADPVDIGHAFGLRIRD